MKKQLHRTLFRAVLLLLSLVCLSLWASSAIVADTGESTYQLTLMFDSNQVSSCQLVIKKNDGTIEERSVASSTILDIAATAEVTVTVVTKSGIQVEKASNINGTDFVLQGNQFRIPSMDQNYTVNIVCEHRTYTIKLLNYNGIDDGLINYRGGDGDEDISDNDAYDIDLLSALARGEVSYQAEKEKIYLPNVFIDGYTFDGWKIKVGPENTVDASAPGTDPDQYGHYYLDTNLTNSDYFDAENAIYIYPVMIPNNVDTYRQDCIIGTNILLSSPEYFEQREVGSQYSAIMPWGDDQVIDGNVVYKSYLGYEIVPKEKYNYAELEVKALLKDNPKNNTVTRYYAPIEYTLVYLDDNGASLFNSGTYTYGNVINIQQPTRTGYTFVGWTVEVRRDGAWVKVMHEGDQNEDKNADGALLYPNVSKPDFTLGNKEVSIENGRTDGNAFYVSEKNDETGNYEIRLTANWKANSYGITYLWGLPANASDDLVIWMDSAPENIALKNDYTTFTYDMPLYLPTPVRPGHSFAGWTVRYMDSATGNWKTDTVAPGSDDMTVIPARKYAYDLELTAIWKADRYTVVLDPADGIAGAVTKLEAVTYGALLTIPDGAALIPTREGYTFEGFYSKPGGEGVQYITRDGAATDALWLEESEDGTIVLYAYWKLIVINDIYTLIQNDGNVTVSVESQMGLHPDSTLTLTQETSFEALAEKILAAIRTPGKITVDEFMSVAEAERILRELDVFAFYRLKMTSVDPIKEGELFTVTIRLSDALKGRTGLQVAYYDEETGMVELLKTWLSEDGEYLIFQARRIADFVILADPILDITPVIIALGAILLLQIIALACLLTMRVRAKQETKLASIAFPAVALTIQFMPVGGEWIALGMAAMVVILQVVLMLLLFRSDFVYRPRRKQEEADAAAPESETPVDEAPADEPPATEAFAYTAAETYEPVDVEQDPLDTDFEEQTSDGSDFGYDTTDPFAVYDTETGDGEDFIEPAVTTRYSLPEDGEAFAYTDDEDADATEEFIEPSDAEGDAFAYADEGDYYDDEIVDAEEYYGEEPLGEGEEIEYVDEVAYDGEDVVYDETVYADEDPAATDEDPAEYDAGAYVDDAYFASEEPSEEVVYVDENGEVLENYVEETDEASEDDLYRYDE